jgi:hypothetical protein
MSRVWILGIVGRGGTYAGQNGVLQKQREHSHSQLHHALEM